MSKVKPIILEKYKTMKTFPVVIPGRKVPVSKEEFLANPTAFPTLKHLLKNADEVYTYVDPEQSGIKSIDEDGVITLNFKAKPKGKTRGGRSSAEARKLKEAEAKIAELEKKLADKAGSAANDKGKVKEAAKKADPAKSNPAG